MIRADGREVILLGGLGLYQGLAVGDDREFVLLGGLSVSGNIAPNLILTARFGEGDDLHSGGVG